MKRSRLECTSSLLDNLGNPAPARCCAASRLRRGSPAGSDLIEIPRIFKTPVTFLAIIMSLPESHLYTVAVNDEDTKLAPTVESPPKPVWHQLFKTTEGLILLLGIAIALAGLIVMGLVAFWSPQTSEMIGAMSFTNLIFGTVVAMSIGYASGYGHALVIPVNMWVETVVVLLFYPVFVLSIRKLVEFPRLKRFLERTQSAAERHHDMVRRYGIAGLFIFVWFPFWMTGPVVGSVIGFLLGFPAWLTLLVVLAGTLMTIAGWAYLLFGLYTRAAAFGPWVSVLIIGLIILVVLAFYLLDRRGRNRKLKKSV